MTYRNSAQRERDRKTIARTSAGCHICGQSIDYGLKSPDPWSFEVDHLVPLSRGGADDLANKAAAHRHCNSKKRARSHAPIVRRSASLATPGRGLPEEPAHNTAGLGGVPPRTTPHLHEGA